MDENEQELEDAIRLMEIAGKSSTGLSQQDFVNELFLVQIKCLRALVETQHRRIKALEKLLHQTH